MASANTPADDFDPLVVRPNRFAVYRDMKVEKFGSHLEAEVFRNLGRLHRIVEGQRALAAKFASGEITKPDSVLYSQSFRDEDALVAETQELLTKSRFDANDFGTTDWAAVAWIKPFQEATKYDNAPVYASPEEDAPANAKVKPFNAHDLGYQLGTTVRRSYDAAKAWFAPVSAATKQEGAWYQAGYRAGASVQPYYARVRAAFEALRQRRASAVVERVEPTVSPLTQEELRQFEQEAAVAALPNPLDRKLRTAFASLKRAAQKVWTSLDTVPTGTTAGYPLISPYMPIWAEPTYAAIIAAHEAEANAKSAEQVAPVAPVVPERVEPVEDTPVVLPPGDVIEMNAVPAVVIPDVETKDVAPVAEPVAIPEFGPVVPETVLAALTDSRMPRNEVFLELLAKRAREAMAQLQEQQAKTIDVAVAEAPVAAVAPEAVARRTGRWKKQAVRVPDEELVQVETIKAAEEPAAVAATSKPRPYFSARLVSRNAYAGTPMDYTPVNQVVLAGLVKAPVRARPVGGWRKSRATAARQAGASVSAVAHQSAVRKLAAWGNKFTPLWAGAATGAGVRMAGHFALAALATTLPGFAAAAAAVPVVSAVVSAVALGAVAGAASRVVIDLFDKEKRKADPRWLRKSLLKGAAMGALGGSLGAGVAEAIAHHSAIFDFFQHHAAAGHVPAAPQGLVGPAVDAHASLPQVKDVLSAEEMKSLSPHTQKLAASGKIGNMIRFCKEASSELLKAHPHDAHAAKLIERGLQLADQAGVHNGTIEKLHADMAYIKAWGLDGHKDMAAAAKHAQAAGRAVHNYGGRLLHMMKGPK